MKDPSFFVDLVVGYRSAKVVFAAHGLGLFQFLDGAPRTAKETAAALALDERATLLLLRACAALELVTIEDGRFANTPFAADHLVPGRPKYVGSNLAYQELLWPSWSALADVVRSGRPPRSLGELLAEADSTFARDYGLGIDRVSQRPAAEILRLLGDRPMRRLLDVGGGLGAYARGFVAGDPARRATLFDLPSTLEVVRAETAAASGAERIDLKAGNYLEDSFGDGYDLVLLSHVTHDESEATNRSLARKAYAALEPGGRVAIHDFVVDESGGGPLFSALFAVHMLVYTRGGRVYSIEEYRRFLVEAGFRDVASWPILPDQVKNPTVLIVGTK